MTDQATISNLELALEQLAAALAAVKIATEPLSALTGRCQPDDVQTFLNTVRVVSAGHADLHGHFVDMADQLGAPTIADQTATRRFKLHFRDGTQHVHSGDSDYIRYYCRTPSVLLNLELGAFGVAEFIDAETQSESVGVNRIK